MKALSAAFCIATVIIFVNGQDKLPKIPGCEKLKDFSDIPLKKCCETLPKLVNPDSYKDCVEPCKSKDDKISKMCCMTDCVLKAAKLLNDTGYFDFEAAKAALNEKVSNDEKWVEAIKQSVETCITEAPETLEKWKKMNPPKCDTAINMVAKHCMVRQLFFKCPAKTDSDECKQLEEFGHKCPLFPRFVKKGKEAEPEKEE